VRTIIAGGRDYDDWSDFEGYVDEFRASIVSGMSVVSGMARGADSLAVRYAEENELRLYEFPADWDKHGKSAGHIRNSHMAAHAEALLAFWDGKSKGTKNMIDRAVGKGLLVKVVRY
tara:strand:- start:373 stop:723 length:351 start_codon:yes stop_codon:yes gene_type:complete